MAVRRMTCEVVLTDDGRCVVDGTAYFLPEREEARVVGYVDGSMLECPFAAPSCDVQSQLLTYGRMCEINSRLGLYDAVEVQSRPIGAWEPRVRSSNGQ